MLLCKNNLQPKLHYLKLVTLAPGITQLIYKIRKLQWQGIQRESEWITFDKSFKVSKSSIILLALLVINNK